MRNKLILCLFLFLSFTTYGFGGVDLDGVDDYLDITNYANFSLLSEGTIFIRFNADSASTADLLCFADSSDANYGNQLRIVYHADATQNVFWGIRVNNSWYIIAYSGNYTAPINQINTFMVAVDSSGTDFYINGESVSMSYSYGSASSNYFFDDLQAENNMRIGSRNIYGGSYDNYFDGNILDVAIWNTKLSSAEAKMLNDAKSKIMPLQLKKDNLVMALLLDDVPDGDSADGLDFKDYAGKSNYATGADGSNNTGLTSLAEIYSSYP